MSSLPRLLGLALLLAGAAWLRADAPAPADAAGEAELQDPDVYYAPIDDDAPAADGAAAATATARELPAGSHLSRAVVTVYDLGSGRPLDGAEIFLKGAYLGRSPLTLGDQLIDAPLMELDAHLAGCYDAARPAVAVPAEGALRVAMVPHSAARWYTTPGWILGLGLMTAAAVVYDARNSGPGLALVGGGVGVIALTQLMARLVHLPALRRRAEALNARPDPAPDPADQP